MSLLLYHNSPFVLYTRFLPLFSCLPFPFTCLQKAHQHLSLAFSLSLSCLGRSSCLPFLITIENFFGNFLFYLDVCDYFWSLTFLSKGPGSVLFCSLFFSFLLILSHFTFSYQTVKPHHNLHYFYITFPFCRPSVFSICLLSIFYRKQNMLPSPHWETNEVTLSFN